MSSKSISLRAGALMLGGWIYLSGSVAFAQPPEHAPIPTHRGESIDNPNKWAPSREIPLPANLSPKQGPSQPQRALTLSMGQALQRALQETPNLRRIESRIRQADYRVEEAFRPIYPTANFNAQYSRVEPPVSFPGGPVISPANNYQMNLVLSQVIHTFGRLRWSVLARRLGKRVVEEEYQVEINRLIGLVAQRYIEVLLAREQVLISEDELEAQLANLRSSKALFEQGVAARFDVLRNSAATSNTRQQLLEAQSGLRLAKARLLSLLNEPLDREVQLEALAIMAPSSIEFTEAKVKALENRPDLRAVRWAVQEAKAQVEVAIHSNKPTLEIRNTTTNRNATGFSPSTQNTTALVLSVPLFDGGLSRLQREQAKEAVQQLVLDLENREREVLLQIEEVFQQMTDRWEAIQVAQENVLQANEALRVALLRYENGISTNVELLESQAARSRARFQLAQARGNMLLSRWAWWQATAGEYPVEVPLNTLIRARLDAENRTHADDAFGPERTDQELGPIMEEKPLSPTTIEGLEIPAKNAAEDSKVKEGASDGNR